MIYLFSCRLHRGGNATAALRQRCLEAWWAALDVDCARRPPLGGEKRPPTPAAGFVRALPRVPARRPAQRELAL